MSVSKCFTGISFDYKYLIQKVIIDVHHYNAIGRSMRRYVICCNNYFVKESAVSVSERCSCFCLSSSGNE